MSKAGSQLPVFSNGYMNMKISLRFGNIVFCVVSDVNLQINQDLTPFLLRESLHSDVHVRISWDWDRARLPKTELSGRDALQEYYEEAGRRYALSIGNGTEYLACAAWELDMREIVCYVNGNLCGSFGTSLGTVMRFLPIRAVLSHFGVLFFHASQIAYRGTGILFTAPSGTGKTTQAKLWKKYKSASVICNDRTLIQEQYGTWYTYGYPQDGSEPVRSKEEYPLGSIILLEQGKNNRLERLNGIRAVRMLMEQLVLDGWDADARTRAIELLLALLEKIPVYLYICTKEPDAVDDLEKRLISDGVFTYENNQRPPLG